MAELVHIAGQQDAMNRAAAARDGAVVLFDTDPLITAVWAEMMFGEREQMVRQLHRLCRPLSAARHRPALCRRRPARICPARRTAAFLRSVQGRARQSRRRLYADTGRRRSAVRIGTGGSDAMTKPPRFARPASTYAIWTRAGNIASAADGRWMKSPVGKRPASNERRA